MENTVGRHNKYISIVIAVVIGEPMKVTIGKPIWDKRQWIKRATVWKAKEKKIVEKYMLFSWIIFEKVIERGDPPISLEIPSVVEPVTIVGHTYFRKGIQDLNSSLPES